MKRILLDSDVVIDILRDFRKTVEIIEKIVKENELCVSGITEAEIFAGEDVVDESKKKIVRELLLRFKKFNPDNKILELAAEFKRKYKISLLDCIIAATAHSIDAELFTRNLKDFEKIVEVKLFRY